MGGVRAEPATRVPSGKRSEPRGSPNGDALRFAEAARCLGAAARLAGLAVPAFRSPPRVPGARRTLRRYPGGVVVSVILKDRPFDAVATDMVEGVLLANRLTGEAAVRMRTVLLGAVAALASRSARVAERQTQAA